MGKKKFIDKKAPGTHSFALVHRSQRDPLAADPEAPQLVLQPNDGDALVERIRQLRLEAGLSAPNDSGISPGPDAGSDTDEFDDADDGPAGPAVLSGVPRARTTKYARAAELAEAGVMFGDVDEYDYSQHLRVRGEEEDGADIFKADPKVVARIAGKGEDGSGGLTLPTDLLASEFEEEIGILNRAAPVSGPRLDWDPDIVAAMDEAELGTLDLGDPENVLLDDFVLGADMLGDFIANGDEGNDDLFGEGGEEDWDTDGGEGYSDDGQDLPDMFGERFFRSAETETVKSRFTEYSMSSCAVPRSEAMSHHDARFEQFYGEYDDENIGALDDIGDTIGGDATIDQFENVLNEFIEDVSPELHPHSRTNMQAKAGKIASAIDPENQEGGKALAKALTSGASQFQTLGSVMDAPDSATAAEIASARARAQDDGWDGGQVREYKDRSFDKTWDCESILSTRSTLYNHPTRIVEPSKKIRVNSKGMPVVGTEEDHRAAREAYRTAQKEKARAEAEAGESEEEEIVQDNLGAKRDKSETKEEKKARKDAIKAERASQRARKKNTTSVFKEEEKKQKKLNASNPQAMRKVMGML